MGTVIQVSDLERLLASVRKSRCCSMRDISRSPDRSVRSRDVRARIGHVHLKSVRARSPIGFGAKAVVLRAVAKAYFTSGRRLRRLPAIFAVSRSPLPWLARGRAEEDPVKV